MEDQTRQYDDSNRAYLQAFLARGSWTFDEARSVLAAILTVKAQLEDEDQAPARPEDVTQDVFESYNAAAAAVFSQLDFQIRSAVHQVTRERIWAITNTTSDLVTQDATTYTADELSFLKRMFDAMFDENNTPRVEAMAITSMQAMKLARPRRAQGRTSLGGDASQITLDDEGDEPSTMRPTQTQTPTQAQTQSDKGLKLGEVETLMSNLVSDGWLELSEEGFYTLSARALMELRSWLLETYNDPDVADGEWQRIKTCEACRDIVTVGQRCDNRDCTARLHDVCEDAFWRVRRDRKCPRCQTQWEGKLFVGEKAITTGKTYRKSTRGGRKSQGSSSRSQAKRSTAADEEVINEDDDNDHDGGGHDTE